MDAIDERDHKDQPGTARAVDEASEPQLHPALVLLEDLDRHRDIDDGEEIATMTTTAITAFTGASVPGSGADGAGSAGTRFARGTRALIRG